jgi:hypothetical protein
VVSESPFCADDQPPGLPAEGPVASAVLLLPKSRLGATHRNARVVVEAYEHPKEGHAVDVSMPDESSFTGFRYDNVILAPGQFVVVPTDLGRP